MATGTPLIGRDDVVSRAEAMLDSGSGGLVLVGAGGVGKSRLAAEIVALAADRGHVAVSTIGTQAAAGIPLGALAHLLPDLSASTTNILTAARAALAERAGDRRLLIAVDDAHLLDDHSAALVLQLAMSMPATVVATVRSGEAVPDAVVTLWKDGIAERIEVGRLDDDSIRALAAQVLGGLIDDNLAGAVIDRADGNALVARELCLAGLDAGAIVEGDGAWRLVGELRVSARLVELVTSRIDGLAEAERATLDLIAHGEPIGVSVATDLTGMDPLLDLERRGVVVLREDGRRREVWLSHPIYADVLRATAGRMLAASIKGRLADAINRTGMRRRSDVLRVATLQLEAGLGDPVLLRRAAAEAYRAGDMVGTARLAAGAWDRHRSAEVGLLLATALAYSGRYEEADAIFAAGTDLAEDAATLTRIAIVHAAILSTGMGQPEAAIRLLTEVETRVDDAHERAVLRGQRAHLLALGGEVDATLELTEPLLAEHDDGPVLVTAAMASMIAHELAGAYERVVAIADQALPASRRLWAAGEASIPPEMFDLERYGARVSMGELAEPLPAVAGAAVGVGAPVLNRPVAILAALQEAGLELRRGRPRSAARVVEAVGPIAADLLGSPAAAILATCAALQGDGPSAQRWLDRSISWRRPGSIYDPFGDDARVWTQVAAGQPEEARRLAAISLDASLAAHRWGHALGLAHTLARIGGVVDAQAAIERIGDRVDGPLAAAMRSHVTALDADDPAGLAATARTFEAIGADLLAAEAAVAAGRLLRRHGEPRRATALLRRAEDLSARCEGARTPGLVLPIDELTPLSRRELEVADLAAAGLSSEDIAGRLFLSVRTVDNHLGHVYQKLGITSRSELTSALGRGDP